MLFTVSVSDRKALIPRLVSLGAAEEGPSWVWGKQHLLFTDTERHLSQQTLCCGNTWTARHVTHLIPLPAEFFNRTPRRVLFLSLFEYASALIAVFVSEENVFFIMMFSVFIRPLSFREALTLYLLLKQWPHLSLYSRNGESFGHKRALLSKRWFLTQ